jgi:hypothetical protein
MGTMINKRLPGATIVETIVAMVIILLLFGMATTVFVQVSLHSFSVKRQRAADMINAYALATGEDRSFINEELTKDGFVLKKEVENYQGREQVAAITFMVLDVNNELLARQKRLFRVK